MICPASIVRDCQEKSSHVPHMYLHLRDDHTPAEMALALLAWDNGRYMVSVGGEMIREPAAEVVPVIQEILRRNLKDYPPISWKDCDHSKWEWHSEGANDPPATVICSECGATKSYYHPEWQAPEEILP